MKYIYNASVVTVTRVPPKVVRISAVFSAPDPYTDESLIGQDNSPILYEVYDLKKIERS